MFKIVFLITFSWIHTKKGAVSFYLCCKNVAVHQKVTLCSKFTITVKLLLQLFWCCFHISVFYRLHIVISMHLITITNGAKIVFVAVGNICSDFTSNLKYISQIVKLGFITKKRSYRCKVILFAKDRRTDKTIFYTLVKIRSVQEADTLPLILDCFENYLHKYYNFPDSCCSESSTL